MSPHALPPSPLDTVMQSGSHTQSTPIKQDHALSAARTGPQNGTLPAPSTLPSGIVNGGPPKFSGGKTLLHVEVRLKPRCSTSFERIEEAVRHWMMSSVAEAIPGESLSGWDGVNTLRVAVHSIFIAETSYAVLAVDLAHASLQIHVYSPNENPAEEIATSGAEAGEQVTSATMCTMPNASVEGLWESLIYPEDIKNRLLNYIYATVIFSNADVDTNIVAWNRVVLLHGPPGTGKTSLCRALAQKLSIRLSKTYSTTQLIEINSHSLFSRWFSESGKLVQGLFASVQECCEEEDTFVVVLIDEVESLTAARSGSMSSGEPTDALRVVNALLTQLDKLKQRKNVLVVTTSNLPNAIDSAFTDRADIVQYIGLPPQEGIYWILRGCLMELVRAKIIAPITLLDLREFQYDNDSRSRLASERLFALAGTCTGMSGRSLRRLPVLAHAKYIGAASLGHVPEVEEWMDAMQRVVVDENAQKELLGSH